MPIDVIQIATATVATLTPFMPFLAEVGKAGGQKLAEVIAEKGGETAWQKAQGLWGKIKAYFESDPEVKSAATMVATKPEDQSRRTMLVEVLAERLKQTPELALELLDLLGGQERIQEVLADQSSWVEDVTQRMKGGGQQTVKASRDSVIKNVRQINE